MIVPRGAEISLDAQGQLSIRTPGNLVLQASGSYGVLESQHGSIRIEPGAEIEAVIVRSADACVIGGSLTAWKVEARSIQLEDDARAQIVLQEAEELEVGHDARLVGNFASERELFLLFSRFARQLRALPLFADRREAEEPLAHVAAPAAAGPADPADPADQTPAELPAELPVLLRGALQLLEEEAAEAADATGSPQRIAKRIAELLRARELETLAATHRTLFGRITIPSERITRAAEMVAAHFDRNAA